MFLKRIRNNVSCIRVFFGFLGQGLARPILQSRDRDRDLGTIGLKLETETETF